MDTVSKPIAELIYPCSRGDWSQCKTKSFCQEICSDYTRKNRKKHISDIVASITSAPYTGNIVDFERHIVEAIFPCNEGGDWHVCKQCKCPEDAIILHRRMAGKIIKYIYEYCAGGYDASNS